VLAPPLLVLAPPLLVLAPPLLVLTPPLLPAALAHLLLAPHRRPLAASARAATP